MCMSVCACRMGTQMLDSLTSKRLGAAVAATAAAAAATAAVVFAVATAAAAFQPASQW